MVAARIAAYAPAPPPGPVPGVSALFDYLSPEAIEAVAQSPERKDRAERPNEHLQAAIDRRNQMRLRHIRKPSEENVAMTKRRSYRDGGIDQRGKNSWRLRYRIDVRISLRPYTAARMIPKGSPGTAARWRQRRAYPPG